MCIRDRVYAAPAGVILHFDIETYQLKDDDKYILVMQFLFTDNLVCSVLSLIHILW